MAVTSSIPVAWLQTRECQHVIPRGRQVRIMPCLECAHRAQPLAYGRNLLSHQVVSCELRFSETSSFQIHVACRKTLYGHQTSSLFLLRLSGLAWPREESLVVGLPIVLRRCNSFQHEVFRLCTHPEANFVCRKTSLDIFRQSTECSCAIQLTEK